jgi:hypothetical protein
MVLFGLIAISSGCTTTEARQTKRLVAASQAIGVTKAQPVGTRLPEECVKHMERVLPKTGEKARWTQKRWEFSADNIDAQIDRCAQFDEDRAKGAAK